MIDNRTVREITGGGTYITTVYLLKLKREHCGGIDCTVVTVECQVLEKVEEETRAGGLIKSFPGKLGSVTIRD